MENSALQNLSVQDLEMLLSLQKTITQNGNISKRIDIVETFGWDVKFGYHLVRLLNECEMILTEGDLDLLRNREQLKSIRRGEWTLKDIESYFTEKEKQLEKLYNESKLQHSPDERAIKQLLINCLEHHYGSLEKCIVNLDQNELALKQIKEIVNSVKGI